MFSEQHEAIAEFPSQQFYFGKLTVGKEEQSRPSGLPFWPAGVSKPIALLHCVGKEEALAVDTEEGGEQSKSNSVEIYHAVSLLFHDEKIPASFSVLDFLIFEAMGCSRRLVRALAM